MLCVTNVLRRISMTWVHVYEYYESNRDISRNAENLENRLTSEFLTHASSLTTAIINVTSHQKELILKLNKMSCKESFWKIIELLVKCHCLKLDVLFDWLHVNSLMRRKSANIRQNNACHVTSSMIDWSNWRSNNNSKSYVINLCLWVWSSSWSLWISTMIRYNVKWWNVSILISEYSTLIKLIIKLSFHTYILTQLEYLN